MINTNVLAEYSSKRLWTAPTFGVYKKNKEIRIISDFRKLNDKIKRHPWSMTTIQDMLQQCGGMKYSTALNMILS